MDKTLAELAHEIEAAFELTEDLSTRARGALQARIADLPANLNFESTDEVLGIVHKYLPGWSIQIRGTATRPNGHWHCSLRKSDIRDNDQYVGIGNGPTLSHALLAAILFAVAQSH